MPKRKRVIPPDPIDHLLVKHQRLVLRWLRQYLKKSQEEFAEDFDVSQTTLGRWEVEETTMNPRYRRDLINTYLRRAFASPEGQMFVQALEVANAAGYTYQRNRPEGKEGSS